MRKPKTTKENAILKIQEICNIKNYEFYGFCDKNGIEREYVNTDTYLKLFCRKCNKIWCSTTYNRFTQGVNCPNCKKVKEETALSKITKLCKQLNYEFLGFCNKKGEKIEWNGVIGTYLKLKCKNCGNIWYTCSYDNFIRGRKCVKCKSFFKTSLYEKLLKICKKNNWKIIGFYTKLNELTTWEKCDKILLKCGFCGHEWYKCKKSLHNNSNCPACVIQLNAKKRISNKEQCLIKILDMCKKRNYIFKGFCDKNGVECEWYGSSTYLILECLECKQVWKTCTYYNFTHHLRGCPKCKQSHLELKIKQLLIDNDIIFEEQKHFEWLGYQSLDFYIPHKNIAIECQGRQHFQKGWWSDDDNKLQYDLDNIIKLDNQKNKLCSEHNISLIYFSNLGITYPYEVIENEQLLLKKITE